MLTNKDGSNNRLEIMNVVWTHGAENHLSISAMDTEHMTDIVYA